MRFKKIFFRAAALAAAAAMMSCGVWAVDSEYDYDFQIDVSMFSNAELGTVGGRRGGEHRLCGAVRIPQRGRTPRRGVDQDRGRREVQP